RTGGAHGRDRAWEGYPEEGGMKRILVVEDNEPNRELLCAMMEGSGYEVEEACNGAEALAAMQQRVPDLVLTDMQMPLMDGLALLQEVRKSPSLAGLKVLAV